MSDKSKLLDDLLSEHSAHASLSQQSMLHALRLEKQRRKTRRFIGATAMVCGIAAAVALLTHRVAPRHQSTPAYGITPTAAGNPSESFSIHRITDAELLDLLAGPPVALMELPGGRREIMILVRDR